ncbi:transcriptional regulator BetI [Marivita sp.]|uniref:choline-binding transcriptional repressor BetI n=1 Tax=Marivita sp. TaxID=2003365 RepID=UPI0025BC6AD5|nr:transcriptional regulator BetI [Marivita sp.]
MASEAQRRTQLVEATVHEIGEARSLNVTVSKIAKRAGVSSGLAFHYFGDKDRLFLAAMRYILTIYGAEVRGALAVAQTPRDRVEALIRTSFSSTNFRDDVISAWLNFYVLAQSSDEARRLLSVYHRRLHSNLTHDLRPQVGDRATAVAERIGGLIDGLYLRSAIIPQALHGTAAMDHVLATLDIEIGQAQ